jgi:hypothetical protein
LRKIVLVGSLAAILALLTASIALGALISGVLPTASFTYTSDTINDVNMAGSGVHLKTHGATDVKTTYSVVLAANWATFNAGWHYHNGPVIVTVTNGTLTFYGSDCETWDVSAGQTFIETTGQVLNARILASKNTSGNTSVDWFTVRLYPDGAADPVPVDPPCTI